jgi:hypothetical protein
MPVLAVPKLQPNGRKANASGKAPNLKQPSPLDCYQNGGSKKVGISGVFSGDAVATVFSPRLPRTPPRLHQRKTTATEADSPKHPSKTPGKRETPA